MWNEPKTTAGRGLPLSHILLLDWNRLCLYLCFITRAQRITSVNVSLWGKTRSFWCIMHFLWTFVIWILVKCEKVLEGWLLVSATGFSCGFCRGWNIHHKMDFVVMQDVLLKTDPTKGSFLKLRPWLHQPYKSMTVWHIMSSGSEEKASGQAALQVQKRVAADLRFFYLNRPSFLAVGQI